VGYTNAGKTTLFNKLTGKSGKVENKLFTTLDSEFGRLYLPEIKADILISDTIGFIKNLIYGNKNKNVNTFNRPSDIVLTIDKNIQAYAEDKLEGLLKKWNARAGTIIVQDPNTGKILAMADKPSFDPNNYSNYQPSLFLNKSVQEVFEPGSSYKPITMSAGLDLGKVTPQTTYTDAGFVQSAGYTIHNFSNKVFGFQTMCCAKRFRALPI